MKKADKWFVYHCEKKEKWNVYLLAYRLYSLHSDEYRLKVRLFYSCETHPLVFTPHCMRDNGHFKTLFLTCNFTFSYYRVATITYMKPSHDVKHENNIHPISVYFIKVTPWLMEPGGPMPHSQDLSNNPYPETNPSNSSNRYLFL